MGVKWQTPKDVAALGERIRNTDSPRFKRFLEVRDYVISHLKGPHLDDDTFDSSRGVSTNNYLEFTANLEPDLAFQLPEAEVYTSKAGAAYVAARGAHHALNVWMQESSYEKQIRLSATDYIVGYAVRVRGVGPKSDLGPETMSIDWPWSERLSPKRFGWDTDAENFESKEYAYQIEQEYQHDLLERAKQENEEGGLKEGDPGYWKIDVIEKLKDTPPANPFDTKKRQEGKIDYYVIYLPDADATELLRGEAKKHPERYNGVQLYVVAETGPEPGFQEIREAMPCMCPDIGPYTLIGMQTIPDESIPSSVLLMTIGQSIEYNAVVSANNRAAKDWKNLLLVDDKRLAQLIESGKHNTVYYHASLDKDRIVPAQVGGLSDQNILQEERAKDIYAKAVGLTDAERGEVSGNATATENSIAAGASGKRRAGQINTFHLGIEEDLYGVLWLLWHTDTVIVEQGPDAVDETKSPAPVFFGGDFDRQRILDYYERFHPEVELGPIEEGPEILFSDLQLRVRVDSMGRKSPEERLIGVQAKLGVIGLLFSLLRDYPFANQREMKRWFARETGIVELPEFIDDGLVDITRSAMLQMQLPPPQNTEPQGSTAKAGPKVLDLQQAPKQLKPQNTAPPGMPTSQDIRSGAVA